MKLINSLFIILLSSFALVAQQPTTAALRPINRCRTCVRRTAKILPPSSTPPDTSPPADFFVGEARVNVTKDETVVRLAMAQHGSVLIELPANDGPRYIIPGDPEMATVDQKALERNKRAIVVRPGEQFLPPPRNVKARTPAATVTAQMRSGLVVTFLFYPVEDLAQNVHRCVLSYSRDEVVARRRAAGLPVNLDGVAERGEMTAQSAATITISLDSSDDDKSSKTVNSPAPTPVASPSPEKNTQSDTSRLFPESAPANADVRANGSSTSASSVAITHYALEEAIKKPKQFKNWTKPVHGLSLALQQSTANSDGISVVLIAVRNKSPEQLQLAPGSPDLLLELTDESGKSINLQSVKPLGVEASNRSGAIAAGAIAYYAIAYRVPPLTTHQQLKLVVAQTQAADEPAAIKLGNGGVR